MNFREPAGVVHGMRNAQVMHCKREPELGWIVCDDQITCVACLAVVTPSEEFAMRVSSIVALRAYQRCVEEVKTLNLRPGDEINYKHTFNLECTVVVGENGGVTIKDSK